MNAIVSLCMLKDHYVIGACISAWCHRQLAPEIQLVVMCDQYIYNRHKDILADYYDQVKLVDLDELYFPPSPNYKYHEKYGWITYSCNKWQCMKYTEYQKVLFLDVDILPISKEFYNVFNNETPSLHRPLKHSVFNINHLRRFRSYADYLTDNPNKIQTLDGGIVLLTPNLTTYEEYKVFLKDIYRNGINSYYMSGPDETSLYYFISYVKKIQYSLIPDDQTVVFWELPEEAAHAKAYNYLSRVKPWVKPMYACWPEEKYWRRLFNLMPKSEAMIKLFDEVLFKGHQEFIQCSKLQPLLFPKYYETKYYNQYPEIIEKRVNDIKAVRALEAKIPMQYGITFGELDLIN